MTATNKKRHKFLTEKEKKRLEIKLIIAEGIQARIIMDHVADREDRERLTWQNIESELGTKTGLMHLRRRAYYKKHPESMPRLLKRYYKAKAIREKREAEEALLRKQKREKENQQGGDGKA